LSDVLSYDPASYRNKIRMSSIKHLLVEGKDDRKLFKVLLEELLGSSHDIKVDSAENINFGYAIGNREKVEIICNSLSNSSHADKILGFVDREFRGFEIGEVINDTIGAHNIVGRVVWSRGHSVENYYFDFDVLRKPLRSFTATPFFDDALSLLESHLSEVLRLACATSLTGYELGYINVLKRSIDTQTISLSIIDEEVHFDLSHWNDTLIKRQGLVPATAESVINTYETWINRLKNLDANIIRWLCHGHTGLAFIWAAYAACVQHTCYLAGVQDHNKEARNVLKAEESVRFSVCADIWTQKACRNLAEHPIEIFKQMGLIS
jgi:hypothetical protein